MPLLGCASSTMRKLSVVRPTTNGTKKTVRSSVAPRRLDRTSTASVYPSSRIGSVTIAVYTSV